MATGLGLLGISARDFWAMTPRELDAALRGRFGDRSAAAPFARGDLATLMKRFPDHPT